MNILLVDDHSYNRDLLRFILEDEGHSCLDADSGEAAIAMFSENEYIDLILMDVNMPNMNGIDATQIITQKKGQRNVTIIFVTALDDSDVLVKCLNSGGDDFIPKPVNELILLSKINAHARNIENYNKLLEAHNELNLHNQSIRREHEIVDNVFKNSLSRSDTVCDNVTSYSSPMSMFNGDLLLSTPSPSGGHYFLIGDFTGHGLSAAIGSLPVISVFFDFAAKQCSVSELAIEINLQLFRILPMGMFFCAAIGHIDKDGNQLTVWSGGLNEALCLSPCGDTLTPISGAHMALGILKPEEFDDSVQLHKFEPNSRIFFYTDGIDEAQNPSGELFGEERIQKTLLNHSEDYINQLLHAVRDFTAGEEQDDDISIIEVLCTPCVHRKKNSGEIIDIAAEYHSIDSFPWSLELSLESQDLKRTDIVNQLVSFLGCIQGIELHQDKLFTIISELFNNSLEHGVLKLESSLKNTAEGFEQYYLLRSERLAGLEGEKIDISLKYVHGTPNYVELDIIDSGDGFNFESTLERIENSSQTNDDLTLSHGRGLGLLKNLCSTLEYSQGGRQVRAQYSFTE